MIAALAFLGGALSMRILTRIAARMRAEDQRRRGTL